MQQENNLDKEFERELALYRAFPSIQRPRTEDIERQRRLAKVSAIHDVLSQLGQAYYATRGADVRPYDPTVTRGFLQRYRQMVDEDMKLDYQQRLRDLQMGLNIEGEKRKERLRRAERDQEHQRQLDRDEAMRIHRETEAALERAARMKEHEKTLAAREAQDKREIAARDAQHKREIAARDAEIRREQQQDVFLPLRSPDKKPIANLDRNLAEHTYSYILQGKLDAGEITPFEHRELLRQSKLNDEILRTNIISYWEKYPKSRNFVNRIAREQMLDSTDPQRRNPANDPAGLNLFGR